MGFGRELRRTSPGSRGLRKRSRDGEKEAEKEEELIRLIRCSASIF